MKNYLPDNTQKNRVRGYRLIDIALLALLIVSVGLLVMRNWGVPSQKELLAIEQQVEILQIQQRQQSLEYSLGVQQKAQRGLITATDALQSSVQKIEQQAEQ